jgi:hypothetical protein
VSTDFVNGYGSESIVTQTETSAGCYATIEADLGSIDTLGVKHVLSAGWELVPYSFVIDWFVDVSNRLGALEGSMIRPILGSWIQYSSQCLRTNTWEAESKMTGSPPAVRTNGSFGYSSSRIESGKIIERIANPAISALPHIVPRINWKKLADSASLLRVVAEKLRHL